MIKFIKTNGPLFVLGILALLILGRILELRKVQIPQIKEREQNQVQSQMPKTNPVSESVAPANQTAAQ